MTTPPLPPAQDAAEPKPSRTKLWVGGAAAAALTLGIAVPVMAESGDQPRLAEPAASTVVMDADEMAELEDGFDDSDFDDGDFDDGDFDDGDFDDGDFEELTAEDIEEINADTDALVAYLADNGVTVDVETDEDGLRFPVLDDADDATWDLVDRYYEETYGDEWDDVEEGDFELTPEDIEEINAETDAIVAYLADNGVTVDVETDEDGVRWPAIDDEDDAAWELVDEYFVETYGDDFDLLEGCDFDEDVLDQDDLDEDDHNEDDLDEDDHNEDDLDEDDLDEDEGEA